MRGHAICNRPSGTIRIEPGQTQRRATSKKRNKTSSQNYALSCMKWDSQNAPSLQQSKRCAPEFKRVMQSGTYQAAGSSTAYVPVQRFCKIRCRRILCKSFCNTYQNRTAPARQVIAPSGAELEQPLLGYSLLRPCKIREWTSNSARRLNRLQFHSSLRMKPFNGPWHKNTLPQKTVKLGIDKKV